MIARVRVVVEVPYDYEVGEPDENGNLPGMQHAAEYADTVILDEVKQSISSAGNSVTGTMLDDQCIIEEVRQA
jgi:hypothetical protein